MFTNLTATKRSSNSQWDDTTSHSDWPVFVCLISGQDDCKIDGYSSGDMIPMCGVAKVMKLTGFIRLKTFCSLKIPTAKRQIRPPYSNDQKNFSSEIQKKLKEEFKK